MNDLNKNMDARVWVKEWMKTIKKYPNIPNDAEAMLGWFANSIMAGYDFAMKQFSTQFGMNKTEDQLTASEAWFLCVANNKRRGNRDGNTS